MERSKILQIIHVSDLHFGSKGKRGFKDYQTKVSKASAWITHQLDKLSFANWEEGTDTHFEASPRAFTGFLKRQQAREPEWFAGPTWLVDTGDLTTFGDPVSIDDGKKLLNGWLQTCGGKATRQLFGNHDAWAGYQPIPRLMNYRADLSRQRAYMASFPEWDPDLWIDDPLTHEFDVNGKTARLELYALDSVGWSGYKNFFATGEIEALSCDKLRETIRARAAKERVPTIRLLATHHPIAFPYLPYSRRLALIGPRMMEIADVERVAGQLSAEGPSKDGPLMHILLSGHAHGRFPGGHGRTYTPDSLKQKGLASGQWQLVASSLMLNKEGDDEPKVEYRNVAGFDPAIVDKNTSQAEILRFSVDDKAKGREIGTLHIERIPVSSIGTTAHKYKTDVRRTQHFTLPIR